MEKACRLFVTQESAAEMSPKTRNKLEFLNFFCGLPMLKIFPQFIL